MRSRSLTALLTLAVGAAACMRTEPALPGVTGGAGGLEEVPWSPAMDLPPASLPAGASITPPRTTMKMALDLALAFGDGVGTLTGVPAGELPPTTAFPWRTRADRARATGDSAFEKGRAEEGGRAIILSDGQTWCLAVTPAPGARLRLQPMRPGQVPAGRLEVQVPGSGTHVLDVPAQRGFEASSQVDLPLAAPGELCFSASGFAVALVEPRIVEPAPASTRPRWVVLVAHDGFRADALNEADTPASLALAARGRRYTSAFSTGSHTNAAQWPLLAGRDLMRIDPLLRLAGAKWGLGGRARPMSAILRRPNLFVSQLLESAGYRSIMVGNNVYATGHSLYSRTVLRGSTRTGTVDTAALVPDLLARYADEPVFLTYFVTSTHTLHTAPRRLEQSLGCAALAGLDASRCLYRARVIHAEEAVQALLDGMRQAGLLEQSLVAVTSDHGELFGDGWPLEGRDLATWRRLDFAHGHTVDPTSLHVPLLLAGPGIAPGGVVTQRVTTLGLVPTLLELVGARAGHRLDADPLPRTDAAAPGPTTSIAYGFCAHALVEPRQQTVWWDLSTCGERRLAGTDRVIDGAVERWRDGVRVPLAPSESRAFLADHAKWLAERLPRRALLLDFRGTPPVTVRVEVDGRLLDYGPVSTVVGLDRLAASIDGGSVTLSSTGYGGLYAIVAEPGRRVRISIPEGNVPLLGGPLQLPFELRDRWITPAEAEPLLGAPPEDGAAAGALRVFWEDPDVGNETASGGITPGIENVLREWGYIR